MDRTDYPAMLAALTPSQAVDVLNDRVNHVGRLNAEVAEWLAERRRLEEVYANGLRKLARRQIQGMDLGVFSVPWSTLATATDNQANSHASLATKIDVDVEKPLRDFFRSSREAQALSTMHGNLAAVAKEVDAAHAKIDKQQGRGERSDSSKVASANSELEQAQSQWESTAPYVFESLQALDESRLIHLRDVLTQLQTHEVDQVEKDRVTAEQVLNVLLNVEIADEIKTFALKTVANKPRVERPPRQQAPLVASATNAGSQLRPTLAPTMSTTSGNDDTSQRAGSFQEEDKKKGPLKGLKRLSTVMGRKKDRSSKLPSQLEPMAEASETKTRSSPFSAFGRGKKKDAQTLEPLEETSSAHRPFSPPRVGSEAFEPATPRPEQDGVNTHAPATNIMAAGTGSSSFGNIPNGSHQNDLADLEPPKPQTLGAPQGQKDAEGYSVPAQDFDPITRAQQEAAAASGSDSTTPQYNVNIRSAPIAEEGADPNATLADVASKLQMQAPPPQRRAGTIRGRRDNRNSAFISPSLESPVAPSLTRAKSAENTPTLSEPPAESVPSPDLVAPSPPPLVFNPSASTSSAFSTLPVATDASPFKPATRALASDNAGDNYSIRSGRSLSSTTSQGHKHPELVDTGLNVSIIETVNARFEQGKSVSSSLLGEIALAYVASDFSTPFATENIRINNFSLLDKVAPNPAFVNPSTTGRDGEYAINLAAIGKTQVAFKYQTRLDDASSHAPLLISPVFKIEPTQASIIVHYSLNPAFKLHGSQTVTLSNAMLALTLEGTKATGCQSRPVGTFSRERNLIFWQLGDITLKAGAAPQKLLARFTTESEAQSGNVETRWEIAGEQTAGLGSGLAISVQGQNGAVNTGSDPFADEDAQSGWKEVRSVKKLASGSYSAK